MTVMVMQEGTEGAEAKRAFGNVYIQTSKI